MKVSKLFFIALFAILLNGCSTIQDWWGDSNKSSVGTEYSAAQLYQSGEAAMQRGSYTGAIEFYEAVEANYPFSEYYEKALRGLIYAYYERRDAVLTAAAAERYIRLYPRSEYVDYAYYMKGMANFEPERGFLARYFTLDEATRDSANTLQAYNDFAILVRRFPNSQYTADAQQRMLFLRNLFAEKELKTAEFYMNQHMYVAASNRASFLLQNFSQSPHSQRALEILAEANRKLGAAGPAEEAQQVLDKNFRT